MCTTFLPALLLLTLLLSPALAYEPTTNYDPRTVQGFNVYVNKALLAKKDLADRVLALLDQKLAEMRRLLPAPALTKLTSVSIWMELDRKGVPGGVYHPNPQWLAEHDVNPEKVHCVEFGNAQNFINWMKVQPAMVIHEFAHAYHDLVITHADPRIRAVLEQARKSGKYDSVLYYNGEYKKAYAMNNQDEYFAESTEAYFYVNDFYPFVRPELKAHDPLMYTLLEQLWGITK
jgi:hypothetical protein